MSKNEFLDLLRQALEGEVDHDIIEQNIRYYDAYINANANGSEESVLNELGDPRLIAKTIIETDKIARQKSSNENFRGYSSNNGRVHSDEYDEYNDERQRRENYSRRNPYFSGLQWYHKILIGAILAVLIIILLIAGSFLMRILYVFAIPILLIFLLYSLFRRR